MATNSTSRINLFHILKALDKGGADKEALLEDLGINISTFYKHVSMIKKAGFKIKRNDNVYDLIRYKNFFSFAKSELNIFVYLLLMVYVLLPRKKSENFINAVEKMLSLASKDGALMVEREYEANKMAVISQYYSEKIAALNKYLNSSRKIVIISKEGKEFYINPVEFFWEKNKLYLKFIEDETIKSILLDDVVKVSDSKMPTLKINQKEVIFELYGKLSKSYLLKEEERIIDFSKNKIVVASNMEDKMQLFRRLLRYDILCKVVFPKSDALEFKKMIEESLANIEQNLDNK